MIGCEDRLRNDLYCVECGVKLYSNQQCSTSSRRYERQRTRLKFGELRFRVPDQQLGTVCHHELTDTKTFNRQLKTLLF